MPVKDWLPATVRAAAIDRKLKSGEALFRLGDKTAGLCEVIAGRVRMARVDRAGHEVILYVAGPGETLAEASLFSPAYHCDAIASTDALVRIYPKAAVLAAFEQGPQGRAGLHRDAGPSGDEPAHAHRAAQHPLRARARPPFSRASMRAPTAARSIWRHAQGSRRRTRAHPRGALPHAGRARAQRRNQAGEGKDHAYARTRKGG